MTEKQIIRWGKGVPLRKEQGREHSSFTKSVYDPGYQTNDREPSYSKDIFQVTWNELKGTPEYQQAQDTQEKLYRKLQEAESMLYQGLIYIRNRYEGGKPPV